VRRGQLATAGYQRLCAEHHDYGRTVRLAAYGGLVRRRRGSSSAAHLIRDRQIFAPIMSQWYRVLERVRFPNPTVQLAARVGLDQFAITPCVVAIFYTSQTLMEGKSLADARQRLQVVRTLAFWDHAS
jgi:protein Mpv17